MNNPKPSSFFARLARFLSLVAAATVVLIVLLYPRAVAADGAHVPHGFLVLLMFGMSCAWVHGFGFRPKPALLQLLFSPWCAWPLLALGAWGVFFR